MSGLADHHLADIHDAHCEIADLLSELRHLAAVRAGFDEVLSAFQRFACVVRAHFDLEERHLRVLAEHDEVRDHMERHRAQHDLFLDVLDYCAMRVEDRAQADLSSELASELASDFTTDVASEPGPDIVAMIPVEHFREMAEMDEEMFALLTKYGLTSSAKRRPAYI